MPHLSKIYEAGPDGVMLLGGRDVRDLLDRFGSPLVVMLEDLIRAACRTYREQMADYPAETRIYYASKAFLTTGFCRLIEDEGLGLDVVSIGELNTALAAGFPVERILMHGNAKTQGELELALRSGVGRIVIDNMDEIERLAELASAQGCRPRVMLRVTPGVKPSTHRYVQTGQVDSKFGFNLEGGTAEAAARRVLELESLELVGLHCHIGSQIYALKPFAIAARTMVEFYARLQKELGAPLGELNLGGGLGIRYLPDDCPPSVTEHLAGLREAVTAAAAEFGVEPPVLFDEPGRSIVGRAGVTLYTVQSLKRIEGLRNYVSLDGGMTDNPRFALYESHHEVVAATKLDRPATALWSVSGRCCESGDMLQRDVRLPELGVGDVIAMLSTGAYTFSMASQYNRVPRPAVILLGPDRVGLLSARETPEELMRLDRIPEWLER